MVAPVWSTPAGFLGTYTQQIQFIATGSNITLSLQTDLPNSTFSIISGSLPSGLHIYPDNGIIYGTPFYTNQIVTSEFVVRASNSEGVADRTFSIDIEGPRAPTWVTTNGLLAVGPNLEQYALNKERVYLQLNATTPKLPKGQQIRYYLKPNAGRLPPGLTLNQQGLLSGIVDDVLNLSYSASIDGGYDQEFYDSAPYDHVVIIRNEKQGRPEIVAKVYQFTVVATMGFSSAERSFLLRVEDPNAFRADNVELSDRTLTVIGALGSNTLQLVSGIMPTVGSIVFGTGIQLYPAVYVKSIDFVSKTFVITSTLTSNINSTLFSRAPLLNDGVGSNTALSADSKIFLADVGFLVPPTWTDTNGVELPAVANLGTYRSNNYQIIPLNTYDAYPYEGPVYYDWLARTFNPEIRMVTDSVFNLAGIPTANLLGLSQIYVKSATGVPRVGMQLKLDGYVANADNKIYTIAGVTANDKGYILDLGITTKYISDLYENALTPTVGYNTKYNLMPSITSTAVGSVGKTELVVTNIFAVAVGMNITGPGVQNFTQVKSINTQRRTVTLTEPLISDVNATLTFGPALGDTYHYYNTITSTTHYVVWTDAGWIDYGTDPGYIVSGTGIIKLSTKILDTTNIYCGSKVVRPPGLELDTTTGDLYGVLPYQPNYSESYKFTVRVVKQDYATGDIAFRDQMFSLTLQGNVQTTIEFVSTSSVGVIVPGIPSELQVVAKHTDNTTLSINYIQTAGKLPNGIVLQRDGTLIGKVPYGNVTSIDFNTAGFDKFKLDQGTTTFDKQYSFDVTANDIYLLSSVTKSFTVTVDEYTPISYTGIYLKPLMAVTSRQYFRSLVQDYNIFSSDLLYRPDDPAFGIQNSIKMYLEYGLEELNLDYYMPALVNYFKRKRFYFGDLKIATAKDDLGNSIYEVIYVDIVDDQMIGNINPDASFTETSNGTVMTFYPDSVGNMQTALENIPDSQNISGIIGVDNSFRPRFMKTIQSDTGIPLGFVKAVILCYAIPGKGADIISRIKTTKFDFKQLDFDVDRLYIEQSKTSPTTSYLLFGTGAQSSGFNIVTEDGILDPTDPEYNAQYIQFIAGADILSEDGAVLTI